MEKESLPEKDIQEEIVNWKSEKESRNFIKELLSFLKDTAIMAFFFILISSFLVIPFQIKWQSMYESYYDREFILVDKFSYLEIGPESKSQVEIRFTNFLLPLKFPFFTLKKGTIQRWDVVVFKPHVSKEREYFIKRIIGLPGDTLKIEWGKVYILGKDGSFKELQEDYLSLENKSQTLVWWETKTFIYVVPEWEYFVMGDNRIASTDSRTCFSSCLIAGRTNYIPTSSIIGKVLIDFWYFNIRKLSFIHPQLGIDTSPRFFSSPSHYNYNID
jgi:signal peptidase I